MLENVPQAFNQLPYEQQYSPDLQARVARGCNRPIGGNCPPPVT